MDAKRAAILGFLALTLSGWTTQPKAAPRQAKTAVVDVDPMTRVSVDERGCQLGQAGSDPLGVYRSDPWTKGEVVLTFDDGPHPYATPKVLDLLAKHGFSATFFVVGHAINDKTFRSIKRMVAEGHTIGSHSYNHDVDMGFRDYGERSVEYIRGQHEITRILIDLSLLADSESEFDTLFTRVFAKKTWVYLSGRALRDEWPVFAERHHALLKARGYAGTARPYQVKYSRPPGGGPYLGSSGSLKRPYGAALASAGLFNVMWHGESGDANATRRGDRSFLENNLAYYSRRGGILLIHDQIRQDSLAAGLARMAADPQVRVVPLEHAVRQKFGCGVDELPLSPVGP